MFKAFNTFLTTLFTALNSLALTLLNLATWAEETSGAVTDESRANRAAAQLELNKQLKLSTAKPGKATTE